MKNKRLSKTKNAPQAKTDVIVVGIGGSAGGIDALQPIIKNIKRPSGLALVYVSHLPAKPKSTLAEMLQTKTPLIVLEVKNGMKAEQDHLYVMPSEADMLIEKGVFKLRPRHAEHMHYPINTFFESLAFDQKEKAVGVIISGTGDDGTNGIEAIKAAGGTVIVQDSASQFEGMPSSARASHVADLVLPLGGIARALKRLQKSPFIAPEYALPTDAFGKILLLVRDNTGIDFTSYKHATIKRRIARRMAMNKLKSEAAYLRHLSTHREELEALGQDILINVTEFFRDPELYVALRRKVFPRLIKNRPVGASIRIWVPGCSTGEEVYSLAIALNEYMRDKKVLFPVQIFGTDISDSALTRARLGRYSKRSAANVPDAYLKRYFQSADNENFQIARSIRDLCLFAKHNMVADTPFSNLDMVSCRNVLIYLDSPLQKKALSVFHYALRPQGHLVLGTSETIAGFQEMFDEVDKRNRIYVSVTKTARQRLNFTPTALPERFTPFKQGYTVNVDEFDAEKEAHRILLSRFTPSWVIVNEDLTILQFRGETYPYIEPAPGKATFNILKMARKDLVSKLSEALTSARKTNAPVSKSNIRAKINGSFRDVKIDVVPMGTRLKNRHFLVMFSEEKILAKDKLARRRASQSPHDEQISQLQRELIETTEYLQSLIEKQEVSNEELRSANEEVMSSNEELQSLNEELETAQEELRSSNEELIAVNEELQIRNEDLKHAKEALEIRAKERTSILENIQDYAIFLLDPSGIVASWNKTAEKIKGFTADEIIGKNFTIFYTPEDIRAGKPKKLLEVAAEKGRAEDTTWRLRKDGSRFWGNVIITPIHGSDGKLTGFVKVTRDLSAQKELQNAKDKLFAELEERIEERTRELAAETAEARASAERLLQSEDKFAILFYNSPIALTISDLESGELFDVNDAFLSLFGFTREEVIGRSRVSLGIMQKEEREGVIGILKRDGHFKNLTFRRKTKSGHDVYLLSNAVLLDIEGKQRIFTMNMDISAQHKMEQELRDADKKKNEFISILSHELRNPLAPILTHAEFLQQYLKSNGGNEELRETAEVIARQVRNMARLLDDLLDVSRILRNKVELRRETVDIKTIVMRAVETSNSLFETKNIRVDVSVPEIPLVIHADPVRMEQILVNILNNAAKFSKNSSSVDVKAVREGDFAAVHIRDEGTGISPQLLSEIFQLFVQADQTMDRTQGGLGIGLALAKNLVELHGGTIDAKSEGENKGSEFIVRLPLQQ